MENAEALSLDRATLLARLREDFRGRAEERLAFSREFCAVAVDIENEMNMLWLQSMTNGSEAYQVYLVSPLWRLICKEVLLRDGHRCQACGRDAEVVHHRSYGFAVMAGQDDRQLISLCGPCHRHIHFDKEEKTPSAQWEKKLRYLQKRFRKTIRRLIQPDARALHRQILK